MYDRIDSKAIRIWEGKGYKNLVGSIKEASGAATKQQIGGRQAGYTGQSAEFQVMANLVVQGFEVQPPAVGIQTDLIITTPDNTKNIISAQVKDVNGINAPVTSRTRGGEMIDPTKGHLAIYPYTKADFFIYIYKNKLGIHIMWIIPAKLARDGAKYTPKGEGSITLADFDEYKWRYDLLTEALGITVKHYTGFVEDQLQEYISGKLEI